MPPFIVSLYMFINVTITKCLNVVVAKSSEYVRTIVLF